jgi:TolB-like protein
MEFDFKEYIKELQRRHVVKAGLAYLVMSWLILQVLDVLLPIFGLGESSMKVALAILSLGFPIWLVIAWAYDFSPEGIKKTEDVPFDSKVSAKKNLQLNRFIIGGLTIAVILLLVNTFRLSDKVEEFEDQALAMGFTNSLAILPFEDLSPNKEQRYFSDGLSRSIYDRLARYKELKLISPTSSFQYRDRDVSIEVIAEELGVRYILEGSVQLYGDHYRASINLVDTKDGSTIWSKTFEDSLENVLKTYDEVSDNVGKYLDVTLTSEDVRQRKVDPEAYLLYLKAEDTLRDWSEKGALAADSLIRKSIQIDPTYASSQITLSMTTLHKGIYYNHYQRDEALEIGLSSAHKAIELDSNNANGYIWKSNWQWHAKVGDMSEKTLHKALTKSPNDANVIGYLGNQRQRQNRILESLEFGNKAIILDPKNPDNYLGNMYSHLMLGNFTEAEAAYKEFFKYSKDDFGMYGEYAYLYLHKGDLKTAMEYANKEPYENSQYIYKSLIYIQLENDLKAKEFFRAFLNLEEDPKFDKDFYAAVVYAAWGKNDEAFDHLNKAYDYICAWLEWFFTFPEFENLYNDPRWDAFIDRLSEEFSYDFPHRPI